MPRGSPPPTHADEGAGGKRAARGLPERATWLPGLRRPTADNALSREARPAGADGHERPAQQVWHRSPRPGNGRDASAPAHVVKPLAGSQRQSARGASIAARPMAHPCAGEGPHMAKTLGPKSPGGLGNSTAGAATPSATISLCRVAAGALTAARALSAATLSWGSAAVSASSASSAADPACDHISEPSRCSACCDSRTSTQGSSVVWPDHCPKRRECARAMGDSGGGSLVVLRRDMSLTMDGSLTAALAVDSRTLGQESMLSLTRAVQNGECLFCMFMLSHMKVELLNGPWDCGALKPTNLGVCCALASNNRWRTLLKRWFT
mmetsp:Transcript_108851/g.304746  ORF Transcript_108851/g.304746 Transcript_108851/m.304746 type:complete len:323 (-) Transcript_108851:640-1608(-)